MTVTNANGCVAVATGTVTVNSLPNATLSSATICTGQSATLTASGGTNYDFGSGLSTDNTLVVNPTATTSYTVTVRVTDANSCSALATGTVTVNPLPTASFSSATICPGVSTTLTASGGVLYNFGSGNRSDGTLIVNPTTTTTYNVTVTSANGCRAAATSTVTVNPVPTVALSSVVICAGQPATLIASGGVLYNFGSGNRPDGTLIVNPTTTTTYNVTVTNGNGCLAVASGTVTVNPLPNATLSSATICTGQSATLTASGGTNYDFGSGLSTDNTLVVNPTATTSYTVTVRVTDANSCSALATGTVTVNPVPNAAFTSATICTGQSATLTASGGVLYNFGSGNRADGALIVRPTITTTYNVVVTNGTGCTALATATVTVNPLPAATLSSVSICIGQSATLTASGGTSYDFGNGPDPSNTLVVNPQTTTVYTVDVTDRNGCVATATGTVTINPLPNAAFRSATICTGQSATLTATGGTLYNFGSGNQPTGTLIVNPATTTSYTVTVTNGNACSSQAVATVMVNPLPTPTLSSAVICAGASATLTATGGAIYNF